MTWSFEGVPFEVPVDELAYERGPCCPRVRRVLPTSRLRRSLLAHPERDWFVDIRADHL